MAFKLNPVDSPAPIQPATALLYGDPKIGKTTALAKTPGMYILDLIERGTKQLECRRSYIKTWQELWEAAEYFERFKGTDIKSIALDPIDSAWMLCKEYICTQYGKPGTIVLGDMPHGTGWEKGSALFSGLIARLQRSGLNLFFTAHSKQVEAESGRPQDTITSPLMQDAGLSKIRGVADIIGYCHYPRKAVDERKIQVIGSPTVIAGHRGGHMEKFQPMDIEKLLENWNRKTEAKADGKSAATVPAIAD